MKLTSLKLLVAGLLATALSSSALANTFWDSTLTVQGQTLDLGAAGRTTDYAVFTTGGTLTSSTNVSGEVDIDGNVAVNGSSIALSNSVINGSATLFSTGKYQLSGGAAINGAHIQGKNSDNAMAQGLADANTFISRVSKLSSTSNFTTTGFTMGSSMNCSSQTVSISASDSNPVVLKLSSVTLNNSTVTLNGSSTAHFIFDISGDASMAGASKVLLTGGLQAGNVVFVLEGTKGQASMSGGSVLNGIVVAAGRNVTLSGGSEIDGEAITNSLAMSGGSKVKKPKKPSM